MLKKRILTFISIGIILALLIVVGMSFITKMKVEKINKTVADIDLNKSKKDQIANNINNQLSDVLTFDKEGGLLKLYDNKGNLLDELDLKKLSFENENLITEIKDDSKKTEKATEKEDDYVYIKLENNELVKAEIEKNKMFIYDKDGKVIQTIDIDNSNKNISNNKDSEIVKNKDSTKNNTDNQKEESTKEIQNLLTEAVDVTFTNFRTINNELVFRDDNRNILIIIKVDKNKIIATSILKNIKLEGLTSVYLTNEHIYLTFDNNTQITQIPRNNSIDNIAKIDIKEIPNFVIHIDDCLYFSVPDKIGKYDLFDNKIEFIEVGDITLDMYFEDNYLYIVNQFGKEKNNSVLIKINIKNFEVEGIMELKGINSKFIGIENNIAYIRQKDSIKEIDLFNLKPMRAFEREEGVPVQIKNEMMYVLKNHEINILSIKDKEDFTKSFKADGFNLYLIK